MGPHEDIDPGPLSSSTTSDDGSSSEIDMPKDRSSDGWCTDLSKVTYIYDPAAWPTNPKTTCFVCKKDGEKDKLLSCGLTIAKSPCPIRFHRNCLLKYNGGGFDFVGLRKNCQKLSCPLHHCSYCLLHRLLTSTTSFDDDISLVTCTECLQSFHKPCIPGGVIVTKKNLIPGDPKSLSETIVCPHHVKVKLSDKPRRLIATLRGNKRQRLPICCECDNELKGELVPCSKCIRMYHPGCHRFKTRVGPDGKHDPIDGLCEGCILGEFVRHEAPAIALYKGRFYPCETVDISLYPRKTNGDPFRQGLGKPGFVTIRWAGMDKTFACYPHEFVCPLTPASYNAYGKTLHDKEDYRKAWKKLSENCGARRVPLPPSKYTEITKSEYFDKSSPPVFRLMNFHEFRCDCKKGQCKADTCTNIQVDLRECPEDCQIADESGNTRPCNNRQVTEGRMFEGLKMGPAGSKGLGVYATMSILKGTCLGEYAGEIINLREKARRVKKLQKEKDNDEQHYMMDLGPTLVVDCRHKGNIARFINHSCEPNCVPHVIDIVTGVTMGKDPKYKVEKRCAIFTLRNIKEGEELTFDYRMEEHEGSSKPKCSCNSKRCTGFMDGRQKTSLQRGRKRKNEESLSESKTEETITSSGDRDAGKDSVVIKTLLKNYAGNKPDNETDAAKENIESKRAARLAKRKNTQDKSIPLSPSKKQIKLEEEPI